MKATNKKEYLYKCIVDRINAIKGMNEGKKNRLDYYRTNIDKLENLNKQHLNNFNFEHEVKRIDIKLKRIDKLEIHAFAPELNKLHLKDGTCIKASGKITINECLELIKL